MAEWKLCFLLLLPLTLCLVRKGKETLMKTIGNGPDLTPICTNETQDIIILIVCKIRTERIREECRLVYQHGHGFEHECDSRFTLMMKNQTVFLHLTRLKPQDSGNHTCECIRLDGTFFLHLNITVEAEEDEVISNSTQTSIPSALIGALIVIIIIGLLLGFIQRQRRHRRPPEPLSCHPNSEPQDIEPYSTFMQREAGLYSTVRVNVSNTNTNNANMFTRRDTHTESLLLNK